MDKLVETLGLTSLSKSQVSVMAKELDTAVEAFRTRPLDAGPSTFLAADALVLKVREQGRVVNLHALIAVGINAEGYREILGIDVTTAEDGAGWLTLLRSLTARGLCGVRLVTSDATPGCWPPSEPPCLAPPGSAAGPTTPPDGRHPEVVLAVGTHSAATRSTISRTLIPLQPNMIGASSWPTSYPGRRPSGERPGGPAGVHRVPQTDLAPDLVQQPQERLNKEIRRRTDVVGIFPDRAALIRLAGAVLAEQHDEWAESRRYLGLDVLSKSRTHQNTSTEQETVPAALTA